MVKPYFPGSPNFSYGSKTDSATAPRYVRSCLIPDKGRHALTYYLHEPTKRTVERRINLNYRQLAHVERLFARA